MSTSPSGEKQEQEEEAGDVLGEGIDYDVKLAEFQRLVVAMAVAGGAALLAAFALRAAGMVVVPKGVEATLARYGPIPAAVCYLLMAVLSVRLEGLSANEPRADLERRFLAFLHYQTATGRSCVLLIGGSIMESAAYWYAGDPVPAAMALLLLAAVPWWFPTRDRMETVLGDTAA